MTGRDLQREQLDLLAEIAAPLEPEAPTGKRLKANKEGARAIVRADHRDLTPSPTNRPSGMNPERIAALAANIAVAGLNNPLTVRELPGKGAFGPKKFRIIDGERRWRAIKLLIADGRWPEDRKLPCIARDLSDLGETLLRLAANHQREDINPLDECEEVAQAVAEARKEYGDKATGFVAAMLGETIRWVQIRVRISERLPMVDKLRLKGGKIGIGEARRLVQDTRETKDAGENTAPLENTSSPAPDDSLDQGAGDGSAAASQGVEGEGDRSGHVGANPEDAGSGSGAEVSGDSDGVSDTPLRDGSNPDDIAAVNARLAAHVASREDTTGARSDASRRADAMKASMSPVKETRIVTRVELSVVPCSAAFEGDDPFPTRMVFADPRTGEMIDYVREAEAERRDGLEELIAEAYRFVLEDRDVAYDSLTNADGEYDSDDDRAQVAAYDAMLDRLKSALPKDHELRGGAAAARVAHNHEVGGSSPPPATKPVAAPQGEPGDGVPRSGPPGSDVASLPGDAKEESAPAAGATQEQWLIYDEAGIRDGTCTDAEEFVTELVDVYLSACGEIGEVEGLWRHNQRAMLRLPGELHGYLATAFETRKRELGGQSTTVKESQAKAGAEAPTTMEPADKVGVEPVSRVAAGRTVESAGAGPQITAPAPALDLKGKIGRGFDAAVDLLGIPKFLQRNENNQRKYPAATAADGYEENGK